MPNSIEGSTENTMVKLKTQLEAAIFAAGEPLSVDRLMALCSDPLDQPVDVQSGGGVAVSERRGDETGNTTDGPGRAQINQALQTLQADYADRGVELKQVASGYRFQVVPELGDWVARLWQEKPARYSRALLETLAIIAYQQPVTRAEIEEIRGVSVSTPIMKNLLQREWVKMVGQRDVPGRPAVYATTRQFLDHFNVASLSELPALEEIHDIADLTPEFDFTETSTESVAIETDKENSEESAEGLDTEQAVQLPRSPSLNPFSEADE